MTLILRHAIYSDILITEATATFMFLPANGNLMINDSYSKLLTAYPHLCCKLGIIPKVWNNCKSPCTVHVPSCYGTLVKREEGDSKEE
eukprot:246013-Pelagomonas_calceolata.AAC.1